MCGRYTLSRPSELIDELRAVFTAEDDESDAAGSAQASTGDQAFGESRVPEHLLEPRFNVAPTQVVPVVARCSTPRLQAMRWGLQSSWQRSAASSSRGASEGPSNRTSRKKTSSKLLINARVETVDSKPSFREAFAKRRCLVLADGFYEWTSAGGGERQPYLLRLCRQHGNGEHDEEAPTAEPFCFAGVWNERRSASAHDQNEADAEFALLTTAADRYVARLHDRMPMALSRSAWRRWLEPTEDRQELLDFLHSEQLAPGARWSAHPVSTRVNRVVNDDPSLVCEVDPPAVNLSLF